MFESLESRTLYAATAGLDATYGVSIGAIRRAAGQNVSIYQAVPGPKDRTYLLAQRYADPTATNSTGYLTIIALNSKGRLDTSYGTGGVALTGRITQQHNSYDRSGLLRLDAVGRLYFADDYRVLRFHPDGSTDKSFGTGGASTFATPDNAVALCDMIPTDNGVLVATTKTRKGKQYFAVQSVGRHAQTVFTATHDSPLAEDKSGLGYGGNQELATDTAQFAQSPGGLVLARVETDYVLHDVQRPADADEPGYDTVPGVKEEDLVVTRFDSSVHGTDVVRKVMRRRSEFDPAALGNMWADSSFFDNSNLVLSDDGRFLLAQTDSEIMRLDLRRGTVQRFGKQPALYENFNPNYQLLRDGNVYVVDSVLGRNFEPVLAITRYTYDGTLDRSFGKKGVLTLTSPEYESAGFVVQMFLSSSGRFSFLATRTNSVTDVAVERV